MFFMFRFNCNIHFVFQTTTKKIKCLIDDKPPPNPILNYYRLDSYEQTLLICCYYIHDNETKMPFEKYQPLSSLLDMLTVLRVLYESAVVALLPMTVSFLIATDPLTICKKWSHMPKEHKQVQFIDAWHQHGSPREIYFWLNNIYSWVGLSLFNIWTVMKLQRG